jgi:undecaprenyl-diphosphatase
MTFLQTDYHLFQLINNMADTYHFLNPVMKFLSQDAAYLFFLGVLFYWFTRNAANRRMVAYALLSACLALGIGAILGDFFYRDRPFVTHHVIQLIPHAVNASFPSDHATASFVLATSIWLFRKKDGWVWLVLAALIAISRVWTGVHYPSDILGGALLGFASAQFVNLYLPRLKVIDQLVINCIAFYEKLEKMVWKERKQSRSM